MADLTDKITLVTQKIYDIVDANKAALQLRSVFYGDQNLIGKVPAACIESGPRESSLAVAPSYKVPHVFNVFILIYHAELRSKEVTKKECEEVAEAIEAVINANKNLDGLVLQGNVVGIDPGYAVRSGTMFRATRMQWQGTSQTRIM